MSDAHDNGSAGPRVTREEYKTYGDIVWEQFRRSRLSMGSLVGVVALFVIALMAPVLAMNVPFFIHVPEGTDLTAIMGASQLGHGTTFPWFAALFDKNLFESGVDLFFNLGLFYVPAAYGLWLLVAKRLTGDRQAYKRAALRYVLAATALMFVAFVAVYAMNFKQPYVNYQALAELDGVSSVFPFWEFSYRDINLDAVSQKISWVHWLGTDREGRDVWTRMIYGTRISLTIGVVAVAIYTFIGVVLGSLAGYYGGRVDALILRMIEVMICFPTFFLILTLRGFIENANIFHIMLIIGLTGWTGIARLVRGEFLRIKNQDFVQAAIALGFRQRRIIFRHILPNAVGPVLVAATFGVAGAILIEASLSFLGLGSPTAPSWGQVLNAGRLVRNMPMILAPGFAIFVTVSLLNVCGEGLRDALDPKLRGVGASSEADLDADIDDDD